MQVICAAGLKQQKLKFSAEITLLL